MNNTVKNLLQLPQCFSNTNLDHSISNIYTATSLHSPLPTVNDNAANSANKDSDDNCKIAIIPPNQTLSAKPGEVFVSRVFKQHETQFTPTLSPPNVTPQQKRKRGRKRIVVKRTGPIYLCGECKKECEEEAFIKKMMSKIVYSLRNVITGSTGGVHYTQHGEASWYCSKCVD